MKPFNKPDTSGKSAQRWIAAPRNAWQQAWAHLPTSEKIAIAVGGLGVAALLAALVLTCQASVQRGERLVAEWQLAAHKR